MNYHIGRLVLSSLCVGAFGAAGFRWCSFFRLKHKCIVVKIIDHVVDKILWSQAVSKPVT